MSASFISTQAAVVKDPMQVQVLCPELNAWHVDHASLHRVKSPVSSALGDPDLPSGCIWLAALMPLLLLAGEAPTVAQGGRCCSYLPSSPIPPCSVPSPSPICVSAPHSGPECLSICGEKVNNSNSKSF